MNPVNENALNQLILRTMLLESQRGEKLIRDAKSLVKKSAPEKREQFVSDVRKAIKESARELMADEHVNSFINTLLNSYK